MQYYEFMHNLGFHSYALPTLAVAVAMVIVGIVHTRNHRKREKNFKEALKEKLGDGKNA